MRKSFNFNVLLLLAFTLLFAYSCTKDDIPEPDQPQADVELDLTDYETGRPNISQHYLSDVIGYWVEDGFPALSRLSQINERIDQDPFRNFETVFTAFQEDAFLEGLKSDMLSPEFTERYNEYASGMATSKALMYTIRDMVAEIDLYQDSKEKPARVEAIQETLTNLLQTSFDLEKLKSFSPEKRKEYKTEIPKVIDAECVPGMDYFASLVEKTEPPSEDDNDTSNPIPWDDVTTSRAWKTTHNGACAALAVGACAAKLGLVNDSVTCKLWNDLSKDICAVAGGGASSSKIAKYFDENGYECSVAWDGLFESAAEEAKAALDRGCDVNIRYISADGTKAHRELVTDIEVNDANDEKATVKTLSWGQAASVTYESGKYSGKSDGRRYRQMGEPKSYLEGKGTSQLIYYCKK